jgi:uncharacterized membrane protein YidH (DUF202 family)
MWEIENYRDHAANERTLAAWLQAEFRRAFAAIVQERVDALMVGNAAQFFPPSGSSLNLLAKQIAGDLSRQQLH